MNVLRDETYLKIKKERKRGNYEEDDEDEGSR
jgi:hypothetical protein